MIVSYDERRYPAAPVVDLRLGIPERSLTVGPLRPLVDTGADVVIVPLSTLDELDGSPITRSFVRSAWGERRQVDVYLLDVGIAEFRLPSVHVVADPLVDEAIVGPNVLSALVVLLDGPRRQLEVRG